MGRGVTRYECVDCMRHRGFIIEADNIATVARYATAAKSPPWIARQPGKNELMAGR